MPHEELVGQCRDILESLRALKSHNPESPEARTLIEKLVEVSRRRGLSRTSCRKTGAGSPTTRQSSLDVRMPMVTDEQDLRKSYSELLANYLQAQTERALYDASLLSKAFVEQGVGPEEIVALHSETIDEASRGMPAMERARFISASFQFLVEVMITYGVRYKEYIDLKLNEATRAIEMRMEIDRIKAEESIKSQEQVLRGKEEFLAFVAHELRNPLTVIMGSIDYMLRGVGSGSPERGQRLLERTRESTERLLRLINDLLSISQMDFSAQPLSVGLVDLDELVHKAAVDKTQAAQEKNIELTIRPPHRTDKVSGDETWLLVVLGNLLDNAIKYTPEGGKVWIETFNRGRRAQIDVGDTGIGIAPELLPHIFERFYRVKGGPAAFVQGTGLGLSLVKRIVERHGGDITVRSTQSEGSVFSVFLPIAE